MTAELSAHKDDHLPIAAVYKTFYVQRQLVPSGDIPPRAPQR
jgi:hypothetical protein